MKEIFGSILGALIVYASAVPLILLVGVGIYEYVVASFSSEQKEVVKVLIVFSTRLPPILKWVYVTTEESASQFVMKASRVAGISKTVFGVLLPLVYITLFTNDIMNGELHLGGFISRLVAIMLIVISLGYVGYLGYKLARLKPV